ncbi:MAG: D-glycerate dehydrogenase [Gemmatimonadota bacterium]|nr:D-glycerate dehydrogenase [Gemmatimonadota bacterium]MDH4352322.1 D-glycerate dehydrogenase [Gemmatimonadota bacterium]MDH5197850.1 D-glycerate dehydrogenase [Gemmatimonadota bacterium]
MATRALIAAELQELLEPDPLPGVGVTWVPAGSATPAGSYAALVPLLSRVVGRAELAGLPRLRIVANCAVGIDNIDLDACAARGVFVTNTPDVLTDATADLTLALLLAVARRFKEGQALLEQGAWGGWDPRQLLGLELKGATLGIVGAGRIGQAVGRRAHAFGMRLCYTSRKPKPTFELETGALRLPLNEVLERSDVVTLHVPSFPTTHHLIGTPQLAGMRRGALLINTARGDVVDEAAVVSALQSGHLGGVGLDVFAREPHVPDVLVRHPRAVVLPHLGSATVRTRRAMAALAVRNVRAYLDGEPLVSPVVMPARG